MVNGIVITNEEFRKLDVKEQNYILFQNLQEIKTIVSKTQIHQKIQYGAIIVLFGIVSFLATKLL